MILKKAQNAVEFLLLMMFIMTLFLLFLLFFQNQYSQAQQFQESVIQEEILSYIFEEIQLAYSSQSGYTATFFVENRRSSVVYNVSLVGNTEVVLYDEFHERQAQVLFLPQDRRVFGEICLGENTITYSSNYGVGIVCGSQLFSFDMFEVECLLNTSRYWQNCENAPFDTAVESIRVQCGFGTQSASVTITESEDPIFTQSSLELNQISYPYAWFITSNHSLNLDSESYSFDRTCE